MRGKKSVFEQLKGYSKKGVTNKRTDYSNSIPILVI